MRGARKGTDRPTKHVPRGVSAMQGVHETVQEQVAGEPRVEQGAENDAEEAMRVLDLFSGIGGFSLGLERAGMRTVGFCEIEPFCRAVLRKHWPHVHQWEDIRELQADDILERVGRPDLICGGFPCQDISCAGKGEGLGGARSGLWWHMFRIVSALHPAWVLAENVPALRTRGSDEVIAALEAEGYTVEPLVVGAEHVGAPHKRHRVWIVAHRARDTRPTGASCQPPRFAILWKQRRPASRRSDRAGNCGG